MTKMLKFVSVDRQTPEKRAAELRRRDFEEIYDRFKVGEAIKQSSRCSQCGVPFCQSGCPLKNNIPDWLMLAAEERLEEAYEASTATSTLPEVCGRICPQDRLCEGACVIEQSGHGTVTIGAVEQFITDTAWERGWVKPIEPKHERTQSIGIIGAGPGGIAAADRLRTEGYQVTIYDRYDRAGGLLTYGIPNFKLEKHVVDRRIERLVAAGVTLHLNCEVGRDITFEELRKRHEAIIIATGVYKARDLTVPGAGEGGVVAALDFLTASNRHGFGDDVPAYKSGELNAEGKKVVVLGGGDTAMDCVRTAIRQGATSVSCLYRRDRANMPGSAREVANAEEEGVGFTWLTSPKAVLGGGNGPLSVRVAHMRLGAPDASGRQAPEEIPGSIEDIEADLVIKALGFEPEDLPTLFGVPALPVSKWGTVVADPSTFATPLEGVYAVGDIVRGASLVVWAVHDGQKAAAAIHAKLSAAERQAKQPAEMASAG